MTVYTEDWHPLPEPAPMTDTKPSDVEGLIDAAQEVCNRAFDQYRARNGRICSIEGDDGEKCWIVPFDAMEDLRRAIPEAATTLAAQQARIDADKEREIFNSAMELAAFAADAMAESARIGAIAGNKDPVEAGLLDESFTSFAEGLRNSKRAALKEPTP